MKNLLNKSILISILLTVLLSTQCNPIIANSSTNVTCEEGSYFDVKEFMRDIGKLVSKMAHPTSKVENVYVSYQSGVGYIRVTYRSSFNDNLYDAKYALGITREGVVYYVDTLYDEAFVPAFTTLTMIKEVCEELIINEDEDLYESKGIVEGFLSKSIDNFDGYDIMLLILNCISLKDEYRY